MSILYVVVSGAADNECNGTYYPDGVVNGRTAYSKSTSTDNIYIVWDPDWWAGGDAWVITYTPNIPQLLAQYYGTPYSDLPANPWNTEQAPAPTPTVSVVYGDANITELRCSYGVSAADIYQLEHYGSYAVISDACVITYDASYAINNSIMTHKGSYGIDGVTIFQKFGSYGVKSPTALTLNSSYAIGGKYSIENIYSYARGGLYELIHDASISVTNLTNKIATWWVIISRNNYMK